MDETTSSSSSSAAAVADSASAAASSKTAASTPTTSASNATSVNLLIKASNQQYNDQIIESDLMWTVKRLKTQLSLVYPSKPPVAEQKLIYSGQLLNDTLQLKDVLRSYKDVYTHNHIFHLVYTPKNAPPPNLTQKPKVASPVASNMSTNTNAATDGLRQRQVGGMQQQQHQQHPQQQPQFPHYAAHPQLYPQMMTGAGACPQYDPTNPHNTMPFSFPGQFNMQAMATQQVAMYNWMQQVYSQYMDQCVRLSNTAGIQNMSTPNTASTLGYTLPPNHFLQQMPFMSPNAGVAANPVIPFRSATATAAAALAQPQAATADVQAVENQPEPQQQVAAAPQQPRFPNIVQDEQDNRDWLDSFFSITRLAIFLTILYFNSSPLRCLVVVIIAGGIYLYHIGVFRLRHERNNNNINRNNNAAADQIRQGVQAAQQAAQQQENPPNPIIAAAAAEAEAEHGNGGADAEPLLAPPAGEPNVGGADEIPVVAAAEEEDNNTTSVISFVRTFVVTFFTSLLPETPAL